MATLLSVNVGLPQDVTWQERTVYTGVWKRSVRGPRLVRRLNVDGDGQGDLEGHGGEQRAVLVYQIESYRYWANHLGRKDFEFGQFGENFTVTGLGDDEVCIGDRYRIGGAEFEVTQPRVTCYRVGLRLGEPEMPALLVSHHRPGFYMRVITEGEVEAGDEIHRTTVGRHALTVAEVDALLYLPHRDNERLRAVVDIPALSPGWQQSFHDLLDGAGTDHSSDGPIRDGEQSWPGFRRLMVAKVVAESPTVTSVYLTAESGQPLARARAGQYLTLRVSGAGDPPPVRSYSLSSDPDAEAYRISIKREPHGVVSAYLQSNLRTGSIVEVAAPRGEFLLTDDPRPTMLISAGIGVTPVLAMLHRLSAMRSTRDVWWIHTARGARQRPFAEEAHRLLESLPSSHEYIFDTAGDPGAPLERAAPDPAPALIVDGRPTFDSLSGLGLPTDAAAYICGPATFMTAIQDVLGRLGIAADRLHTELFGARTAINPGVVGAPRPPPHQPPGPQGTRPQITFTRSGLTVPWSGRYRSMLALADACDIPTRWSCRTGVCHTCLTPLLSGDVSYHPEPLERPPASDVLICCAQPVTDAVVDL
jgi:ferredoxin-NADP reductase/MOSC domain-containing protein YiiM